MEFGSARGPEQPPDIDRCIASMVRFTEGYGEPRVYDTERQLLSTPAENEVADALVRQGQVDVQDMAYLGGVAPIVYEVVVYTPTGIAKTGMVASLTQDIVILLKSVRYQFTPDKIVQREVITPSGMHVEYIRPEEVGFLAEQLASLRPVDPRG